MKYYKLIIMAVLLTMVGRIHADNLTVPNVELKAGETKEVAIGLNNPSKKYAAFQFDLVLPDGVSIAKNDKGKFIASLDPDRIDDHSLNVSDMGSNTYRFLSFSMTNAEYYGTSGTLVKVTLQASQAIGSGTKTASIKSQVFTEVGGDQAKWSDLNFSITTPAEVNVTAPTAKSGLIYNGNAQELVSAGSTNVGTLQYSLDGSNYSTTIPKGTDAKTYTIYYKAVDGNKDLTTAATLTVTISPKTVSSPTIMLSETSYVYDGQEKRPSVTVKDGNTTIPATEYIVSYSKNVNVGTATVIVSDKDGGNYVVSGTAYFNITSASADVTAPKAKTGLVYNGTAQELITAGSSPNGEMQYSLDGSNYSTAIPKGTDAKSYTVYYKVKGDANHSDVAPATLTATISLAPLTISVGNYTMTEGGQVPVFEPKYDGFVNNETEAVLTTKPIITCEATSESVSGRYEIFVSGAEAQNYDISYQSGWLIIEVTQGITGIVVDDQAFDVYNTQGHKVRSSATSIKDLPKGVYIINGKKIMK